MVAPRSAVALRIRQLVQLVIAATVLGVAAAAWLYIIDSLEGEPAPFLRTVAFVIPFWLLWALYAPLVVWLATRYPIERRRVVSRCFAHLGVAVVMSLVHTGARFGLQPGIRDALQADRVGIASWDPLFALAALELPVHLFIYGAIMGVTYIILYYRRLREREFTATRLSAQLADARMQALRMQLNPHFLFNALNTVAALVRSKPLAAEETVGNLAQVLRRTLDRSRRTLATLDDEVDYLEAYLSVEKERFGDRLTVEWFIDPRTRALKIPPMTLQPLVENSLKHGIGGQLQGGTLTIRSALEPGTLLLEVVDDGAGFLPHFREGTGLRNLRERLEALYGGESQLHVDRDVKGASVTVRIPTNGKGPI